MCWKVARLLRPGTGCPNAATPKTTQSAHLHVGLAEKLVLPFIFLLFFLACDFVLVWPIFGDFLALVVLVVSVLFTFFVSSLIVFLYVGLFVFLSSVHLSFSHVVLLSFCPSVLHCHCPPVLPFYYTTQAQSVSVTKGNPFLKCVGSIKWALSK